MATNPGKPSAFAGHKKIERNVTLLMALSLAARLRAFGLGHALQPEVEAEYPL